MSQNSEAGKGCGVIFLISLWIGIGGSVAISWTWYIVLSISVLMTGYFIWKKVTGNRNSEPPEAVSISGGMLVLLLVVVLMARACGGCDSENLDSDGKPKTEKQIELEKQFSSWDGSHYELTKFIKKAMHDPSSFEHVETVYWDMKSHVVIRTTYRGKNAFGAKVQHWVKAKADRNGKIIEIMEGDY